MMITIGLILGNLAASGLVITPTVHLSVMLGIRDWPTNSTTRGRA